MKTLFRFFVCAAALFAIAGNVFSDDAPLIVMERSYYDQCARSFYASCSVLHAGVDSFVASQANTYRTLYNLTYNQWYSLNSANENLLLAQGRGVPGEISSYIDSAQVQVSNALGLNDNMLGVIYNASNNLETASRSLHEQIDSVSNSFPVAFSDTNLTLIVYVIVTNNFDFASNNLEQVENSYTNFLNYYRGIEDWVLDQYRATVTNLLDVQNLMYYIDSSFWNTTKPRSDYLYMNFDFYQGYYIPNNSMFPNSYSQFNWVGRYTTIPDTSSYNQFLNFTLMGVHDSLQYLAKNDVMFHNLIWQAATNQVASYALSSQQTNNMARFLSAPDSYGEQVSKISNSRNIIQRIEHWLSAIAKNTYTEKKSEIDDTVSDQWSEQLQASTNDVLHSLDGSLSGILEIASDSTNTLVQAKDKFMSNVTGIFNKFTIGGNNTRSGSIPPASQRFAKVNFMEMQWANEFLKSKTHRDNDIPTYITLQDKQNGVGANSAWSLSLRLADIVHNVFGVLWFLIGIGMGIFECVMLSKFLIAIWWRLLKFIPKINRYALGS